MANPSQFQGNLAAGWQLLFCAGLAKFLAMKPKGGRPLLKRRAQPAGSSRSGETPCLQIDPIPGKEMATGAPSHTGDAGPPGAKTRRPRAPSCCRPKDGAILYHPSEPVSSHHPRGAGKGETPELPLHFPLQLPGSFAHLQPPRNWGGLWIGGGKKISHRRHPWWEDGGARGRGDCRVKAQQGAPGSNGWPRLKTRGSLNPSPPSPPELEEALQHENTPHPLPCEAPVDPSWQGTSRPSTAELLAPSAPAAFNPSLAPSHRTHRLV